MLKLREVLTDETKWIKGNYAVDAHGLRTPAYAPTAVCFCIVGAVRRCYDSDNPTAISALRDAARQLYPNRIGETVSSFNDHPDTTFEDVVKVIELAGV
jgi:hypothetical protein